MEKGLDSQLWHACAGGMVQMPPVNSKVFYFPQGYAEHAQAAVDLAISFKVPALILCRVAAINFLADSETDEVYAKLNLVPLGNNETDYDEDELTTTNVPEITEKSTSFAKTLTQSDANNGGGFSVPRYCAETIFPKLDYSADPPVQTIIAKDVHGDIWKFRHIYRGTPRRHLLTTGWSTFVNQKKLVAGDSIVFLRTKNGDLCVGIRRAKKRVGGGPESTSGWNASAGNSLTQYGGFSMFLRDGNGNGNLNSSNGFRCVRKVRSDSVIEAAAMAASGQPFEVIYYPRAGTPEFCVKASVVRAAMKVQWTSGMRFKMAFETEDSSRISWFMGTVSSVQVADPIRWPNSPWRLLQVTWDEPDLLQNVKRVSPWLVELVSNMPVIHLSPFSPPRKKLRLPQHPVFPLDAHFPMPSFPGSSFCCLSDNAPAGIQGARHAQFGLSLSDIHFSNKLPPKLLTPSSQLFDQPPKFGNGVTTGQTSNNDGVSCLLTIGNSSQSLEKSDNTKRRPFLLFGQLLVVEEETSQSSSSDGLSQALSGKSSSDLNGVEKPKEFSQGSESSLEQNNGQLEYSSNAGFSWNQGCQTTGLGLDNYHCKVFIMGSEDVVCTLDLSALGSYEELYGRLSNMFGIEREKLLGRVLYRDAAGTLRQTGDEPFSDFMKTAEKLTIHTESGTDKTGRTWLTGLEMKNTEKGLNSSNKTGPLSIFV